MSAGRGINDARIGATQAPSNLDETNFGKFVEAWYTDTYFAGRLRLKAGRQYADSDFGLVANGGAFLNASYGAMPTMPLPTYPDPELGASVWAAPSSRISFGFGVYGGGWLERPFEGAAPVRKRPLAVFETKIEPFSRSASQQGAYRIGVWRQNRAACVPNYGVYAAADHWFRRTETDTHRGPGVFGQWGWTPRDRNQVSRYSGGGFVYQGLTSRRVGDTAGIGVNLVRLASGKSEMIYELFYNCRLSGAVSIQPDVQWVRHAGGEGRSAFVGGLRLVLQL